MPELLLQYVWLKKLFMTTPQQTIDGQVIEILDVGEYNMDAGPDFFNAKIRLGGVVLAGNVEMHIKSSDWYHHKHHFDQACDSVILHVIAQYDRDVYTTDGRSIPQCELKYPHDESMLYEMLTTRSPLCSLGIIQERLCSADWKNQLLEQRMMAKWRDIQTLLSYTKHNWYEAFYITLAHNFGFHTNGLPFEMLAKQTPLIYLSKHRNHLFQLEAILFGQSGLLNAQTANDEYTTHLWHEYQFLQKKFSLRPIDPSMWKLLRMRPQNFPHIRIAQFAMLIYQSESLFSRLMGETRRKKLREMFSVGVSEYWNTHYTFTSEENLSLPKNIGTPTIDLLLINTVAPYKFALGMEKNDPQLKEQAFSLLLDLPAEKNNIVAQWRSLGIPVRSSADSQAYLHLYQNYCRAQRCADCQWGNQIFSSKLSYE